MKGFSDDVLNSLRGLDGLVHISDVIDTIDRIRTEHRSEVMQIEKVSEERYESILRLKSGLEHHRKRICEYSDLLSRTNTEFAKEREEIKASMKI